MVSSYVYTHDELLTFSTYQGDVKPKFNVDLVQLNNEIKAKSAGKNRKKSHGGSDSRRFSSFRKDRAALASTIAELNNENGHADEAAVESNDESGDSDADINVDELSSRFFSQRSTAPVRRTPQDINPKFASAVANSLAQTEGHPTSGQKHPHFRSRRYSSNRDTAVAAPASEEDGWISVGPKHVGRKSFNHGENGYRKRFGEFNRSDRGSFSKTGGRKKSFANSNKPTKAELTAALNGTGSFTAPSSNAAASSNGNAVSSDESDDQKKYHNDHSTSASDESKKDDSERPDSESSATTADSDAAKSATQIEVN